MPLRSWGEFHHWLDKTRLLLLLFIIKAVFHILEFSFWEEQAEGFLLRDPGTSKSQTTADCQDALLKDYLWESFLPAVPHLGTPLVSSAEESGLMTFCNTPVSSQWQPDISRFAEGVLSFPQRKCVLHSNRIQIKSILSEGGEAILISRELEMALKSDCIYLNFYL